MQEKLKETETPANEASKNHERYINIPAERSMIIHDTAKFIKMLDANEYDTLVYMDKSARPLHTLVNNTLRTLHKKTPEARFLAPYLTIGMKDNNDSVPENSVDYVRNTYNPGRKRSSFGHVLIVDERISSRRTVNAGKELFTKAFADSQYGLDHVDTTDILTMYPVWYGDEPYLGIRDPNDDIDTMVKEIYEGRMTFDDLTKQEQDSIITLENEATNDLSVELTKTSDEVKIFRAELDQLSDKIATYYNLLDQIAAEDLSESFDSSTNSIDQLKEMCMQNLLLEENDFLVDKIFYTVHGNEDKYIHMEKNSWEKYLERLKTLQPEQRIIILGRLQDLAENQNLIIGQLPNHTYYTPGHEGSEHWDDLGILFEQTLDEIINTLS